MGFCVGRRRCWAALTGVSAGLLCAAAIYLFVSIHDLVLSVTCISTSLAKLQSTSLGATVLGRLPAGFINYMRQVAPYIDFLSMLPAIVSMLFLIPASLLGCGFKTRQRSFICAKFFVLLSLLPLVLTFAFYLVLTTLALLSDRPVLTDQWAAFTAVCSNSEEELQAAISSAQAAVAQLQSAGATPGAVKTAQNQLSGAEAQFYDFQKMCGCFDEVLPGLKLLQLPGLLGLLATLIALIAVNSLCVAAGCLCGSAVARVTPADAPASAPAPGELKVQDIDDDDTFDDDEIN